MSKTITNCVFLPFYGFICDNFEYPSVKSSKSFTEHHILWDMSFEHKKVGYVKAGFSIFANICLFPLQTSGLIDFPKNKL